MAQKKTTFKYHLKLGSKVVFRAITNDLERRERDHRKHWGSEVRIVQVGRRTTREAALRWEREGGKRAYQRDIYLQLDARLPTEGAGVDESSEYTPDIPFEEMREARRCKCPMCEHHRKGVK